MKDTDKDKEEILPKFHLVPSSQFKKDLKKYKNIPDKRKAITDTVKILKNFGHEKIPQEMNLHELKGEWRGYWECHIEPDLLLIWNEDEKESIIKLARVGSHANLFKM